MAPKEAEYGPAEVAAAANVPRATLHSWLARRYIPVESLGAGRSRRFTFEQVVFVATIVELGRQGIPVGKVAEFIEAERDTLHNAISAPAGKIVLISRDDADNLRIQVSAKVGTEFIEGLGWSQKRGREVFYSVLLLGNLIENLRAALASGDHA